VLVLSTPAASAPVKAKPISDPKGTIKPEIAVALDLSSSENHKLLMRLIELRMRGLATTKMKVPTNKIQK